MQQHRLCVPVTLHSWVHYQLIHPNIDYNVSLGYINQALLLNTYNTDRKRKLRENPLLVEEISGF